MLMLQSSVLLQLSNRTSQLEARSLHRHWTKSSPTVKRLS
ncbi:hypothetical protein MPTK1_2g21070 [Marchantia polymorpha subsp. ruderalis]|nr:hypothetical protein Mp_2g21070 [Marchantia polymorpha subsp. ruderalis]